MKIRAISNMNYKRANFNINFASNKITDHSQTKSSKLVSTPISNSDKINTDYRINSKNIYSTKDGYNLIARHYDAWNWQKFWTENEMPLIVEWGRNKKNTYGADIGVGTGKNLTTLLANNNKIDGFDISEKMLKICQQKYSDYINNGMLNCYNLSVFDINNSCHKYDWIMSNRVISNIEDIEKFIQTLQKVIKTGGECFISDVHPERNYDYTHINIANNDVYIETYNIR